jgi:hypothetical protein
MVFFKKMYVLSFSKVIHNIIEFYWFLTNKYRMSYVVNGNKICIEIEKREQMVFLTASIGSGGPRKLVRRWRFV